MRMRWLDRTTWFPGLAFLTVLNLIDARSGFWDGVQAGTGIACIVAIAWEFQQRWKVERAVKEIIRQANMEPVAFCWSGDHTGEDATVFVRGSDEKKLS